MSSWAAQTSPVFAALAISIANPKTPRSMQIERAFFGKKLNHKNDSLPSSTDGNLVVS